MLPNSKCPCGCDVSGSGSNGISDVAQQCWGEPHKDGRTDAAGAAGAQVSLRGAALVQEVAVANEGQAALEFTAALHSYFRVADIHRVRPGPVRHPLICTLLPL